MTRPEPGPAADDVETARAQLETKALPDSGFEVTDADFDALALAVQAALTALLARQAGVITARLRAPKTRKHTRFWEPENENDTRGGDANIDEGRVVSAARWAEETTNTLAPILQQAASTTARKLGQAIAGVATVPPAAVAPALVTAMYAERVHDRPPRGPRRGAAQHPGAAGRHHARGPGARRHAVLRQRRSRVGLPCRRDVRRIDRQRRR
ncbi:hypothetical protein R2F25_38425 [Streptomyces sp. UP1A-1]|nr:hypothetical protein [Streptomyces sp. UP1A-1]